jgi:hypothetical protein
MAGEDLIKVLLTTSTGGSLLAGHQRHRAGLPGAAVIDASGSPTELSEEMARRRMERAGVI